MFWTLIIVFAFSTGGYNASGGGLTSETLDFNTKESCEAAGKEINEFYKTDGGWTLDTAFAISFKDGKTIKTPILSKDGTVVERAVRANRDKDWMSGHLKIQYKCIQRHRP